MSRLLVQSEALMQGYSYDFKGVGTPLTPPPPPPPPLATGLHSSGLSLTVCMDTNSSKGSQQSSRLLLLLSMHVFMSQIAA